MAYAVTEVDRDANEYRGAVWVARLDGTEEPRRVHLGRATRHEPSLVARRTLARVYLEPRRRGKDAAEHLRHPGRGRRGAQADRSEGERRGDRLVAGLLAHRLQRSRPRRGLRGRGREEASRRDGSGGSFTSSTASASPATAGSTSSSSTSTPIRQRAAADDRRLRARRRVVVARRQDARHRWTARRALGRRAHQPPLFDRRRRRLRANGADRRRRLLRQALVLPRRNPNRLLPGNRGRNLASSLAGRRHERRRQRSRAADGSARPSMRALPGLARTRLGQRQPALHDRRRREHPSLRGPCRRLRYADPRARRRTADHELRQARRHARLRGNNPHQAAGSLTLDPTGTSSRRSAPRSRRAASSSKPNASPRAPQTATRSTRGLRDRQVSSRESATPRS